MSKARSYCFTPNNYSEEDLPGLLELTDRAKYTIWGYEQGENSTPHLQGFVQFKYSTVFSTMKKLIPRAHIEAAKGNFMQNIEYCSKDKDFIEFGNVPTKGGKHTKTIEQIREELDNPLENLNTVRHYSNALSRAMQLSIKKSQRETKYYVCTESVVDPIDTIFHFFADDPATEGREWAIIEDL